MSARTRFSDLSYRCDAPGLWRIVATDTDSSIGPYYASKAELLSDLERYAKEYGCPEAGVSEYISPDAVLHSLRADNARLREALEHAIPMLEHVVLHGNIFGFDGWKVQGVASMIRAVLAGKDGGE